MWPSATLVCTSLSGKSTLVAKVINWLSHSLENMCTTNFYRWWIQDYALHIHAQFQRFFITNERCTSGATSYLQTWGPCSYCSQEDRQITPGWYGGGRGVCAKTTYPRRCWLWITAWAILAWTLAHLLSSPSGAILALIVILTLARIGSRGPESSNDPNGSFKCMNHRQSTHHSAFDNELHSISIVEQIKWSDTTRTRTRDLWSWVLLDYGTMDLHILGYKLFELLYMYNMHIK
jgi:hypothetical protein